MKHYKYLVRRETGVQVRIRYPTEISRNFAFKKYGGVRNAYEAALTYRNIQIKRLHLGTNGRSPNITSSKSHGVIGVYLSTATDGALIWTAAYRKNGKMSRKYFSVNRYGNRAAFLLACQFRFLSLGILRVVDRSSIPCLPKVPYR